MADLCEGSNEYPGKEEMGRTHDATQREPVDTHPYGMGPKDWQTQRWKSEDRWADELRSRFGHLWSRTAKVRQQWKLITK
ncbi:hypothetical protein ANN_11331 [Periplaneta americana]|uniref:Uncharacterized protein n=1 Tax=Periplaneta americana TaxID=6978 RepID=A0ABQ8T4Q7_PERAM|nr:hypothetical protein ANN_11331 [Periplaneta americana]